MLILSHAVSATSCIPENLTNPVNGLEVTLPDAVIATVNFPHKSSSIDELSAQAQERLNTLNNAPASTTVLQGLYVTGRTTQRPDINEHDDYLGLEWQFFRRGYFEGKRKTAINNNRALIDAYRLQHSLRQQALEQMIYDIDHIKNSILAYSYKRLLSQQTQLTKTLQKRMRAGFTTQQVVDQETTKLTAIQEKIKLYKSLNKVNISPDTAKLLNKIEDLTLASTVQLKQQTLSHSGLQELQRLIKQQATLSTPNWTDNLSLGIFARRYHDYIGSQGNEIGLQVAIPVDGNSKNDAIMKHRLHLFDLQLTADKTRLNEKVSSVIEQFQYAQDKIRQLKNEYALLITESKLNCKHFQHVVPTLNNTPEKSQEHMPIRILEKQKDIFMARLDAYRNLMQLKSMVQPASGETWYSIQ